MAGRRPFPVAELVRAVKAEIAAHLQSDGEKSSVVLGGGVRSAGAGVAKEYLFETKVERSPFQSGSVLVQRPGRRHEWVRGEAVWMMGGKVRLTTEDDLGQRVEQVRVREDETAGLEQLAEKLEQAGETDGPVNVTAAGWMVDRGRPSAGRERRAERYIRGYPEARLNGGQRQAVEQALGGEVTFIWGPPGTGKTEVVGRIVEGCFRQGLTLLFLAPTKVAVDQALKRVCDLLKDEDGFGEGIVQRAGDLAVADLETKYGAFIIPERIAERLSADLTRRRQDVGLLLEAARQELAVHAKATMLVQEIQRCQEVVAAAEREIGQCDAELSHLEERVRRAQGERDGIGTPSGFFAERKRARLEELQREIAACQGADSQFRHRLQSARRLRQDAVARRPDLVAEFQKLQPELPALRPVPALEEATAQFAETQRRLDDEISKIGDTVRGQCRVMGTTVAKAVQSRKLMNTVDVVVIDEAGMVDLPSAWYAAGLAGKRVIVAGDFRQLPAVTRGSGNRRASPDEQAHSLAWMDRDVFHAAGLVDGSGTIRRDARLVALNEQYRMRPAICAVVNTVAYPDAPLTTGRDDESELPPSPLIDGPLILVDTSEQRKELGLTPSRDGHKTNAVHEAVIHELIRGLQADTVLPAFHAVDEGTPTDRLAVIAPYRDQVTNLQKSLAQRFGPSYEGLVDTVHRFQGSERPIVVIDLVAGASDKVGFFYESQGLSSRTCRLLNVALSRARDHLIVVADVEFLKGRLPASSETVRMLDYLLAHAQRLPVGELVPFRMASELSGLSAAELVRPAFFPKDEVRRAVEWDLGRAAASIEIYCAFLDDRAVEYWLGRLGDRVKDGVRVVVHTRQENGKGDRLAARLRAVGCEVRVRPHMHEKVLIVDDETLWHGSLNLLANGGPTDLMMRITSRASCARVKQIMARARSERDAPPTPARAAAETTRTAAAPRAEGTGPPPRGSGRPNKYAQGCLSCRTWVQEGQGEIVRQDGRWQVYCRACLSGSRSR